MRVLDKGYVELVDMIGDEQRIVEVARISYGKENDIDEKVVERILKILLENGHYSPLEHVSFTFKVKSPIFVARQWMRHRTGKYNEQSRRYTKSNWEFYLPDCDSKAKDYINDIMMMELKVYDDLIAMGVKPEQARVIIGTGFYTTFYFSIDLRNLLHFLELRTDEHAQYEIQEYAKAIEKLVEKELPTVIKRWRKR